MFGFFGSPHAAAGGRCSIRHVEDRSECLGRIGAVWSWRGAVRLDTPSAEPTLSGARIGRQYPPGRTLRNCARPKRPLNEKRRHRRPSEIDFTQIRTRRFRMHPGLLRGTTRHCAKRLARSGARTGAHASTRNARTQAGARARGARTRTRNDARPARGGVCKGGTKKTAGRSGPPAIRACRFRGGRLRTSCCGSTAGRTPVRHRPRRPWGYVRACRGRRRPAPRPCRRPAR